MSLGPLETSGVIELDDPVVVAAPPDEFKVCAIASAELAAGPHLASTSSESARR